MGSEMCIRDRALKVVDHIQNQRGCGVTGSQGATDLLLVDDWRNRWSEQNHARNAFYMDALVEHIDTEQQLQPAAGIRLEVRKGLVGIRIIRVSLVHRHIWVDPCKHSGTWETISSMCSLLAQNTMYLPDLFVI